jgi:GT2 family glycosyltransferase
MTADYHTNPPLSVLVPNYNGSDLLPRSLPRTRDVLRAEHPGAELLVVDDASTDGSPGWVERNLPEARLLRDPVNRGFGPTVNRGMEAARGELVLLLNSDAWLLPGALRGVAAHFEDPAVFAVTLGSVTLHGAPREGANRLVLRGGLPHTLHAPRDQVRDARGRSVSSYPVGGHCVIRRRYFRELGGFDPRFAPFYWEDADLGWRAAQRGWITLHEPGDRVVHLPHGSIRRHADAARIRRVKLRNRFLLLWVMRPHPGPVVLAPLALRFAVAALTADREFFRAYAEARERRGEGRP